MSKMNHPQLDFGAEDRRIYSVRQLNLEVRQLLQQNFALLWVEGELSNMARPASGHVYFSLKDEHAQARCVMFRDANRKLAFQPEDGMRVLIHARVGLYEPRGEYQLGVEHMEETGVGVLQRKYEELKNRLRHEGLFDAVHKQTLPAYPQILGIVTSASGAALRDILSVLRRRFPLLEVRVYAVPVQGEASARAIVNAIEAINQGGDCDLIMLARGGGSIEDLWSFNEELVARAIFASKLPIVTGVGHETDFTIADFVADVRAATPSSAAELVVPHREELIDTLRQYEKSLFCLARDQLRIICQAVDRMTERLEFLHPKQTVQRSKQQLTELQRRARSAIKLDLACQINQLNKLLIRFENQSPKSRVAAINIELANMCERLQRLAIMQLEQKKQRLIMLTRALNTVSPASTLNRGYAVVSKVEDDQILCDAKQVSAHDKILIRLAKGRLRAHIESQS